MATNLGSESASDIFLTPLVSGEPPLPAWGEPLPGAEEPGQMMSFDMSSDAPLPNLPETEGAIDFAPSPELPVMTPAPIAPTTGATAGDAAEQGEFWVEGNVIMCGCPDCGAPMAVRLWLMIADCWSCAASIELSEEQEREVRRLMKKREAKAAPRTSAATTAAASAAPEATKPVPQAKQTKSKKAEPKSRSESKRSESKAKEERKRTAPPVARSNERPVGEQRRRKRPEEDRADAPGDRSRRKRRGRRPAAGARGSTRNRLRQLSKAGAARLLIRDFFRSTPAWLVSLVFHLVLLVILALLIIPRDVEERAILLSTTIDSNRQEGAEQVDREDEVEFDLPMPAKVDMDNPATRAAMIKAAQDARELRIDPNTPDPSLPPLAEVKKRLNAKQGATPTFAARDPRMRVEVVKKEGGTTRTEAAVARALRYMALHQNGDGSWSLNRMSCRQCSGHGNVNNDSAGTALVLLPYLGAGQTHLVGRYKETISRGLRYLIDNQDPETGHLGGKENGNNSIYAHGQATIVLCEAYAMTGDTKLRDAAEKGVQYILDKQHQDGGWRYATQRPTDASDTSVVGWQLMALQSARAAGFEVPQTRFELTSQYLDRVASQQGSRYSYTYSRNRPSTPTEIMTAEGLLCRMYLGWQEDEPGLRNGLQWLVDSHLPGVNRNNGKLIPTNPNIYYWYYATQALHHYGGPHWEKWNNRMRDILTETQATSGHEAGSWHFGGNDNHSGHGQGGRLYITALATCTLEVYYRHLPIFKQLDLEVEFEE